MFGRSDRPAEASTDVAPAEPVTAPVRERRRAHESKIFQPSTFASRKADAPPPQGRRLVSLGQTECTRRLTGGEIEVIAVELFMDLDHPMEKYVRLPGQRLMALHDTSGPTEKVTKLGTIKDRRASRPITDTFPAAGPQPPPRPI